MVSLLLVMMERTVSRQRFRKCIGILIVVLVISTMAFLYNNLKPPAVLPKPWYTQPAPCQQADSVLDDLVTLAFDMHEVLKTLDVPHAACYGTLWGLLRQGRILPWDTNVDFCTMDVHLDKVSYAELKAAFLRKEILLEYDWRTGVYTARSHRGVEGYVYVFTQTFSQDGQEMAEPGGWVKKLHRWMGQKQLSFPSLLLDAPFNEEMFHGHQMPVPHEGIELLKYQYPADWWLEVKPPGCQ